jgi:hypothetical protein
VADGAAEGLDVVQQHRLELGRHLRDDLGQAEVLEVPAGPLNHSRLPAVGSKLLFQKHVSLALQRSEAVRQNLA